MQNNYQEAQLKAIISRLKKAGITDITTEIVSLKQGGKIVQFQFYTEEQWMQPKRKVNEATRLLGKHFKGYKIPDFSVDYEGVTYLVKIC